MADPLIEADLFMTGWMDQHAVFCVIRSSQRFVDDMVVVPSRQLRDGLFAGRADTVLLFPG